MKNKPNILIFMTDQQRWDVTQPGHVCSTPNLDRLQSEGIAFDNVYPTMAHCCPSRASFMTSLYPSQHGIFNNVSNTSALSRSLKEGSESFSEKLKEAGYDMYYSGKWHVSACEDPSDRGWEELVITASKKAKMGLCMDEWFRRELKNEEGFETDGFEENRKPGQILRPGWGSHNVYFTEHRNVTGLELKNGYEGHNDYKVVKAALDKLTEIYDKGDENPWCMYIGPTGPHAPFHVPKKYAKMYNPEQITLPPNYKDDLKDKPYYYKRMQQRWSQLTESEVRESIAYYYGFCTMLDDMLGEVIQKLEETGQLDNTVIIYTSDHGEMLGSHGLYYKGAMSFEEGYKVPLIVRAPELQATKGTTYKELISLMDIAPTIIEIAGAEKLTKQSGRSLMHFIAGEKNIKWRDALYMQCNGVEAYITQRIVRTQRYKFVYSPFMGDELYDLEGDPFEMINQVDNPEYKEIKKDMYKQMWISAFESEDNYMSNSYSTISLSEYGPRIAFNDIKGGMLVENR